MSSTWDAWSYRTTAARDAQNKDIAGYEVHATDGHIGKVDKATYDVGASQIVVDTGPWIFGRKVLLPAGTIDRVDDAEEKVYVDLTKDQIKDSPELDEGTTWDDADYRERVGGYYSGFYGY
ncbi:PRC-barrel domain-containing protein [Agromyces sp. NPDC058484]|uniref:PRC-barrel domain-containing protein n=1 Tax=Agromyces sp. NPDC058484 TaxID=3346524 RepID=UPI003663161D